VRASSHINSCIINAK